MRFNDTALQYVAAAKQCDREGRLLYKSPRDTYKERWFKLKGNLLFYFRTNSKGAQGESEALGVLVLDRCKIQMEPIADRPFVFSVVFEGEDKLHYFSGQSLYQCQDWVSAFQEASIGDLYARMCKLRERIQRLTLQDPIDKFLCIPSAVSRSKAVKIGKQTLSCSNKGDTLVGRSFGGPLTQRVQELSNDSVDTSLLRRIEQQTQNHPKGQTLPIHRVKELGSDGVDTSLLRRIEQQTQNHPKGQTLPIHRVKELGNDGVDTSLLMRRGQQSLNCPKGQTLPTKSEPLSLLSQEHMSQMKSEPVRQSLPPAPPPRQHCVSQDNKLQAGSNSYLDDLLMLDPIPVKPPQTAYSIDRHGGVRRKSKPTSPPILSFNQASAPFPSSGNDPQILSPSKLKGWETFE